MKGLFPQIAANKINAIRETFSHIFLYNYTSTTTEEIFEELEKYKKADHPIKEKQKCINAFFFSASLLLNGSEENIHKVLHENFSFEKVDDHQVIKEIR